MNHPQPPICFVVFCFVAVTFALPSDAAAQRNRGETDSKQVSFINEVAPIISAKCGKCHVASSKGKYSIKSYDALMNSDSITPRKPDDSYLIEVIENGEMPKGGLKVERKELETLKQWIVQGAKFDGEDESQTLSGGRGIAQGNGRSRTGRSQGRSGGRRSSTSRNTRNSRSNAIETNRLLAFLDKNRDGKLSLAEIDAASRMLYSLDTNRDDRLTVDELQKADGR